jgi:hypothetical protein
MLALSRWPQRTRPGIITHLTGLPFLDYAITVNVTPAEARQEVRREEQATERLRGEYAEKPRASLLVALRKKERKVEALSGGFARPFHVTYLIRVWAPTREGLREKIAAVQAAVHAMDGAPISRMRAARGARRRNCSSAHGRAGPIRPTGTVNSTRKTLTLRTCFPSRLTFVGALACPRKRSTTAATVILSASARADGGSPQHAVVRA